MSPSIGSTSLKGNRQTAEKFEGSTSKKSEVRKWKRRNDEVYRKVENRKRAERRKRQQERIASLNSCSDSLTRETSSEGFVINST